MEENKNSNCFFPSRGFKLYLSVCLPVCLSACPSVCLSVCLFVCLPVCLFVCLSVCLSVCLPVCLFVCLSVCLSLCLSVCHSVCLPASLPFLNFFLPLPCLYCKNAVEKKTLLKSSLLTGKPRTTPCICSSSTVVLCYKWHVSLL